MPKMEKRYTYKLKAAIALAASIQVLTPDVLKKGAVDTDQLYQLLGECGYKWNVADQCWNFRSSFVPERKVLPPMIATDHTIRPDHTRDVGLIFIGDDTLIMHAIACVQQVVDLIDAEVVLSKPSPSAKRYADDNRWY